MQSLNKRKRPLSQGPQSENEKSSTNVVDSSQRSSKERKRLKKIRKDKLRFQSSPDHAQDSFTAVGMLERKHKKKHKCQDDLCKHRKHKKRRKHKKHHHRELDEEDRDLQNHVQNAMSISNDSNNNEEEFDEDSLSLNESVTQYEIVKKVDDEVVIKDDPDTMESSVTESSGSVYVSFWKSFCVNGELIFNFSFSNRKSQLRLKSLTEATKAEAKLQLFFLLASSGLGQAKALSDPLAGSKSNFTARFKEGRKRFR